MIVTTVHGKGEEGEQAGIGLARRGRRRRGENIEGQTDERNWRRSSKMYIITSLKWAEMRTGAPETDRFNSSPPPAYGLVS